MMEFLTNARIAKHFNNLVKDPTRTDEIFKISRLGRSRRDQRAVQMLMRELNQHPEFIAMYERGYQPCVPTLAQLTKMPAGSLGEAYHQHLTRNGLRPDFFPTEPTPDLLGYFILRTRQTHDIWHVLTGYDTSVSQEIALQAFTFAQVGNGLSTLLISGGLLHMMRKDPMQVPRLMELIVEGYERGKRAKFIVAMPWEDYLTKPLDEARTLAGIGLPALESFAWPLHQNL